MIASTDEQLAGNPEPPPGDSPSAPQPVPSSDAAPSVSPSSVAQMWMARLVLMFAIFACFLTVRHNQLLPWDDAELILRNPYVHPPFAQGLSYVWRHAYDGLYMPLVYTSYAAEVRYANERSSVIHLDNVLLHCLTSLIVFGLILRLLPSAATGPPIMAALMGALIFALHPIQTEAVAWGAARKDLLGGLFSLLSVTQYVRWRQTGKLYHYAFGLLAFGLGLLSKATVVAVPLAAVALDAAVLNRNSLRRSIVALLPWFALSVIFVFYARHVQESAQKSINPDVAAPIWTNAFVSADSLLFYARKIFLPVNFSPVYARTLAGVVENSFTYISFAFAAAAIAFLWSRGGLIAVSTGLFLTLALPTLGLFQFHYQSISTVADRYTYPAMAAIGVAAAGAYHFAVRSIGPRRAIGLWPFCLGIVLLLGIQSHRQARVWNNSLSLWQHAAKVAPRSAVVQNNLGMSFQEKGQVNEAMTAFETAVKLKPDYGNAWNNAASLYAAIGLRDEAARAYKKAVELEPKHPTAHTSLAVLRIEEGSLLEAAEQADAALKINPGDIVALSVLASSLVDQGKPGEALNRLRTAEAANPGTTVIQELRHRIEEMNRVTDRQPLGHAR